MVGTVAHTKMAGECRPHVAKRKHFTIGEVVGFVAGTGLVRGPQQRRTDQPHIGCLPHPLGAAGEGQRQAEFLANRGVDADHRRQIHHYAVIGADYQLRAQDRDAESVGRRQVL